jgi:hypothetical protein
MAKSQHIIRSGPLKGKKVELAPTAGIEDCQDIADLFMSDIFDLEPGDYLITDESEITSTLIVRFSLKRGMSTAVSTEVRIQSVEVTEDSITARLMDGRVISVPLAWSWRLSEASPEQRQRYEIIGQGLGVHWPDVDEDISAEGMLHGIPAHRPSQRPSGGGRSPRASSPSNGPLQPASRAPRKGKSRKASRAARG